MNNTKTKTKSYLFAAIGFLLTLALDQWTKYLASTILRRLASFSLISGVFELRYLENRGAAFGIMQNRQIVFVVGGIIILAVILYLYQKMPFTPVSYTHLDVYKRQPWIYTIPAFRPYKNPYDSVLCKILNGTRAED